MEVIEEHSDIEPPRQRTAREKRAKGRFSPKDKDSSMNDPASTAVESIRVQPNLPVTSTQSTAKQQTRVCSVCGDTKPTHNFPALIGCKHASEVCSACYES